MSGVYWPLCMFLWHSPLFGFTAFQVWERVDKAVLCCRGVLMGLMLVAGSHLSWDNMLGKRCFSSGAELKISERVGKEYPAGCPAGNDSWTSAPYMLVSVNMAMLSFVFSKVRDTEVRTSINAAWATSTYSARWDVIMSFLVHAPSCWAHCIEHKPCFGCPNLHSYKWVSCGFKLTCNL